MRFNILWSKYGAADEPRTVHDASVLSRNVSTAEQSYHPAAAMPKRKAAPAPAPGKVHLSECVMYVVLHSSHCVGHSIIDRPLDPLLWQVTVSRPQKKIVPPKAQPRAATFTAPLYEKHSDDKLVKEKVRPSV